MHQYHHNWISMEMRRVQHHGPGAPARPLGVLILGRKRPGFDQEWNQAISARSLAALSALGFQCVGAEAPLIDDPSTHAALDRIIEARCEALVILQPSLAHGQLALSVMQRWPNPVTLWASPERPGDGKVSSCSLVGQHLWASALRQANHPFEFVYGDPDDPQVRVDLSRAIAMSHTFHCLRRAKLGVIGTYAPGFIDLAAEPFLLHRTLGVQLHALSLPQFIERVQALPEETVAQDVQRVASLGLPVAKGTPDALPVNSRCYLAMLELMKEEKLDGLTIQCWPELPNMLGQWPYLAVSRLTSAGHAVAIEGDVDGCISMLMNVSLRLGPSFLTDWLEHDEDSIFFWHPGMAPMTMCDAVGTAYGPELDLHFNIAKPYVVNGRIRAGELVTVMRLWRCDNQYHLTAFEGQTAAPRRSVTGNSVRVEVVGESVPARFDRLLHAGMPHHVLLSFGHHAETFRRMARLLRMNWWD
jgi:L-fucose isomerase-like protein